MESCNDTTLEVSFNDTDGDRIDFRVSKGGMLEEYINDVRVTGQVCSLQVNIRLRTLDSGTGGPTSIQTEDLELEEKVFVLRIMAFIANVEWSNEEPSMCNEEPSIVCMSFTAADGQFFKFDYCSSPSKLIADRGASQMIVHNIKYLGARSTRHRNRSIFKVNNGGDAFEINGGSHSQKVVALEYLAKKAGVQWEGASLIPDAWPISGYVPSTEASTEASTEDPQEGTLIEVTARYVSGDSVSSFGLSTMDKVEALRRQVEYAVGRKVRLLHEERVLRDDCVLGDVLPADDAQVYIVPVVNATVTDEVDVHFGGEAPATALRSVRTRVATGFARFPLQDT